MVYNNAMSILKPTVIRNRITDITEELLYGMQVTSLLLDVDNTLVSYRSHQPPTGTIAWIARMKASRFQLIIVSNNYRHRVEPLGKQFDLPFITFAAKPLPIGYLKAKHRLKAKSSQCAIIGDQLFTDVLGANLCGMKSILLTPIEPETESGFARRRAFEKKFRDKYKEKGAYYDE